MLDSSPGDKELSVSEAVHKAAISFDEEGTEAAAASGMIMMLGCSLMEDPPVDFYVDQPSSFFILSAEEDILFAGRLSKV